MLLRAASSLAFVLALAGASLSDIRAQGTEPPAPAGGAGAPSQPPSSGDAKKDAEAPREAQKAAGEKTPESIGKESGTAIIETRPEGELQLAEIPPDKLPPRTRPAPDAKLVQVRSGVAAIAIRETVRPQDKAAFEPEVNVTQDYVSEYLRRAGFEIAPPGAAEGYRLAGTADASFVDVLTFRDRVIGWKYSASAQVSLVDPSGKTLAEIEIEDVNLDGVKDEATVALDVRRLLAKHIHDKLFDGKSLGHAPSLQLIDALVEDPLLAAEPLGSQEVVRRLADIGLPAVPHLLEAMTDTRVVLATSDYPGLVEPESLKVYHIADKALEEIFQKVSRLRIDSNPFERFVVTLGWENEWRRFCPSFRDSPQYIRRIEAARARQAQADAQKKGEPAAAER